MFPPSNLDLSPKKAQKGRIHVPTNQSFSTMKLRYYQDAAHLRTVTNIEQGKRDNLIVIPVGGGKSVVIAHQAIYAISKNPKKRVILIAHRKELSTQNAEKLLTCDPTLKVGFEKGTQKCDPNDQVMVASILTIGREGIPRIREWCDPKDIAGIFIDEAHHIPGGKTYQTVLDELRAENPELIVTGFTATPKRGDGEKIDDYIQHLSYEISMQELVEAKYLARILGIKVKTETSMGEFVKDKRKDFDEDALAKAVNNAKRNQLAVDIYKAKHPGEKALVFCVNKAHAKHVGDLFSNQGIKSKVVTEDTPANERDSIKDEVRAGNIDVLINVSCLTEGFDLPELTALFMLRPTKSPVLYEQCLDTQTEILTPNGWATHKTIKQEKTCGSINLQSGKFEWKPIEKKFNRETHPNEQFVSIQNPSLDIRVTAEHALLQQTRPRRGNKLSSWKRTLAKNVAQLSNDFLIPISCNQPAIGLPLTDTEIEFLGWIYTDGNINPANNVASISQANGSPYNKDIIRCLEGCGFKYGTQEIRGPNNFTEYRELNVYYVSKGKPRKTDKTLKGWGHLEAYMDKNIPTALENISERQFEILLNTMHKGNGSKQEGQSWKRRSYHIHLPRKIAADRIQSLCIRRGYKCNIAQPTEKLHTLHIKKKTTASIQGQTCKDGRPTFQIEPPSKERVWCVQNQNQTLITRRNGKVAIIGNCIGRGLRLICIPDPENSEGEWLVLWDKKSACSIYDFVDLQAEATGAQNLSKMVGLNPELELQGEDLFALKAQVDTQQNDPFLTAALAAARTPEEIEQLLQSHDLLSEIRAIHYTPDNDLAWMEIGETRWIQLSQGESCKVSQNALGQFTLQIPEIDLEARRQSRLEWERRQKDQQPELTENYEGEEEDIENEEELPIPPRPAEEVILKSQTMADALNEANDFVLDLVPNDRFLIGQTSKWKEAGKKIPASEGQKAWVRNNLKMEPDKIDNLSKTEASDLRNKAEMKRKILAHEGRVPSGKYKGAPVWLLRIHKPSYLKFFQKDRPQILEGWGVTQLVKATFSENPLPWLKNYRPHLYKKDFDGMETFYEKEFKEKPEDVIKTIKFALEQDTANEWPMIENRSKTTN